MRDFKFTVACSRPAEAPATNDFNNTVGEARAAIEFQACFAPPGTQGWTQIVDGALRETTVSKPTLMVDRREANADALVPGAIRSGDPIVVDGETGWQVDGDVIDYLHPWSGWKPPLWIELRRTVGG